MGSFRVGPFRVFPCKAPKSDELLEVLECLIDEVMYSKHPSDTTLDVLSKYSDLQLVKDYFEWKAK